MFPRSMSVIHCEHSLSQQRIRLIKILGLYSVLSLSLKGGLLIPKTWKTSMSASARSTSSAFHAVNVGNCANQSEENKTMAEKAHKICCNNAILQLIYSCWRQTTNWMIWCRANGRYDSKSSKTTVEYKNSTSWRCSKSRLWFDSRGRFRLWEWRRSDL